MNDTIHMNDTNESKAITPPQPDPTLIFVENENGCAMVPKDNVFTPEEEEELRALPRTSAEQEEVYEVLDPDDLPSMTEEEIEYCIAAAEAIEEAYDFTLEHIEELDDEERCCFLDPMLD